MLESSSSCHSAAIGITSRGEPILQKEFGQAPQIDFAILVIHPEQLLPLFPHLFPTIPLLPDIARLRPPTFLKRDLGADSIVAPLFSGTLHAILVQQVRDVLRLIGGCGLHLATLSYREGRAALLLGAGCLEVGIRHRGSSGHAGLWP